jgi:multidrug resistance efflux pump
MKEGRQAAMNRFRRRSVLIPTIVVLAVIIALAVGGYLIYNSYNFYSTDDAQVTGTIVDIVPQVSGTLTDLNVQVGDSVSANQVIGTVEQMGYQFTDHLRAPITGVIVQVPGVIGQQVTTATAIAEETDLSTVKVTAYVDESAIKNIAVGQAADIHVDAYDSNVSGHVTQIVGAAASQFSLLPTTDNSSGNYTKVSQRIPVYVYTNSPPDGSLLPGMSVEVTIHLH